jgi:tetratricopeptide (TPR) repeat protein
VSTTHGQKEPGDLRADKRRVGWRCWQEILAGVVLVVVGLALHLPVLSSSPLLDDRAVFHENPAVYGNADWLSAPFYVDTYRPIWRPLATLSLHLSWQAHPSGARQARQVNVALLILCGLLLFVLLRRLGLGTVVSCAAAAFVIVHPAVGESVQRQAGRSELLSCCMLFAAVILYIGWRGERTPPRRVWATVRWILWGLLFLLALLAKEIALILPVLLAGYEIVRASCTEARRGMRHLAAPLAAVVLVVCCWGGFREGVLRGWPYELKHDPAPDYVGALTTGERLQLALSLPAHYSGMAVCSEDILPDYSHLLARPRSAPPIELGNPRSFGVAHPPTMRITAGVAILAISSLLFAFGRRRWPLAAFGAWWYTIALLAVLPLLGTNGHVASGRHLAIILPGFLIILGAPLEWLSRLLAGGRRWPGRQGLVVVVLLAVLAACWMQATAVARSYRTQSRLMANLGAQAPDSPEAALFEGLSAAGQGDYDRAAEAIEESVSLFPRNPRALMNLGLVWAHQGRTSLAMRALSDAAFVAAHTMPGSAVQAQAHMVFGAVLGEQNLDDEALVEFQKAVAVDSTNVDALARAGLLEAMRYSTAWQGIHHIDRALELDRGRGSLGVLAERIREVRDRAVRIMTGASGNEEAYNEAMGTNPDTTQAGGPRGE